VKKVSTAKRSVKCLLGAILLLLATSSCQLTPAKIDAAIGAIDHHVPLPIFKDGQSALHLVCKRPYGDQTESVLAMLEYPEMLNKRDFQGQTPLYYAIKSYQPLSVIELLIEAGSDAANTDWTAMTPYECSVMCHSKEAIRDFLYDSTLKAFPDRTESQILNDRLVVAVNLSRGLLIDELLSRGANANVEDREGNSMLHLACRNGNANYARVFIHHGVDPNRTNSVGETPLHLAIKHGKMETVVLLVESGASTEDAGNGGMSVTQLACQSKNTRILDYLLSAR
jgi:ankyrin repeat protein